MFKTQNSVQHGPNLVYVFLAEVLVGTIQNVDGVWQTHVKNRETQAEYHFGHPTCEIAIARAKTFLEIADDFDGFTHIEELPPPTSDDGFASVGAN